jgi:tRNA(Arg) A34 adenosine deaminase TadA
MAKVDHWLISRGCSWSQHLITMSMCNQMTSIEFSLPEWISEYVTGVARIEKIADRMKYVIEASRLNVKHKTGGPFAAAVFEKDSGQLVSLGVNLVTTQGLSFLHAEMVAIALAQKKLGTYDLGTGELPTHELVTSTEPCAMCFGAIPWSGVRRVVTAASDADARAIGFDEGPKVLDWQKALEERGIAVLANVLREDASAVLVNYAAQDGHIYNSRESIATQDDV